MNKLKTAMKRTKLNMHLESLLTKMWRKYTYIHEQQP